MLYTIKEGCMCTQLLSCAFSHFRDSPLKNSMQFKILIIKISKHLWYFFMTQLLWVRKLAYGRTESSILCHSWKQILNAEIILIKTLKTFLCVFICGCSYFSLLASSFASLTTNCVFHKLFDWDKRAGQPGQTGGSLERGQLLQG